MGAGQEIQGWETWVINLKILKQLDWKGCFSGSAIKTCPAARMLFNMKKAVQPKHLSERAIRNSR